MSKTQTRRTISVSGRHYAALKRLCALQHRATSAFVEDAIGAVFNVPGHKIDEIERRLAEMEGTPSQAAPPPAPAPAPSPRPPRLTIRIPPVVSPPKPAPRDAADEAAVAAASRILERKEPEAVIPHVEEVEKRPPPAVVVPQSPVQSPTLARPIAQPEPISRAAGRIPADGEVKRPRPSHQVMF